MSKHTPNCLDRECYAIYCVDCDDIQDIGLLAMQIDILSIFVKREDAETALKIGNLGVHRLRIRPVRIRATDH